MPCGGHAVIATRAGSSIEAPDPFAFRLDFQQPNADFVAYQKGLIDRMAEGFGPWRF